MQITLYISTTIVTHIFFSALDYSFLFTSQIKMNEINFYAINYNIVYDYIYLIYKLYSS